MIEGKVVLDRAYVGLAADPGDVVQCGTSGSIGGGGQRTDTTTLGGMFRTYTNGRTRLILDSTRFRIETVVLRALTPAATKKITEDYIGKTIVFRDTYGRKLYGAYIVTAATDIVLSGTAGESVLTDVSVSMQTVDYSEEV